MVSRMVGYFAYSIAGRVKEHIYLIIKEETESVWLVDGKIRTLRKPKRKNKKHIQIIKKQNLENSLDSITDEQIKYAISRLVKD